MYNNGLGPSALAATGFAYQSIWISLAVFALLSAAFAVARILPPVFVRRA